MVVAFQVLPVARTAGVQVDEVECAAPASPLGAEEAERVPRLVLPRRGVFTWHAYGDDHLAEPGCMLVLAPHEPYRFGHPGDHGDDCLRISVEADLWAELVEDAGLPHERVRSTRLPLSGAQRYRNAVFARAAAELAGDPDAVEELALLRVQALLAQLPGAAERSRRPGPGTRARRELAEQAAAFIGARYRESLPRLLDATAAAVHCSPFDLARVFHAEVGVTLHQFRERLRLGDALRMLPDCEDGLAALSHRLGYANHSHFTAAFRRACGATPSAVRATLRRTTLAEVRRILTA